MLVQLANIRKYIIKNCSIGISASLGLALNTIIIVAELVFLHLPFQAATSFRAHRPILSGDVAEPEDAGRSNTAFCRSPSSALSHPFLGEGSPTKIDVLKKVGALILTSQIWRT